MKFSHNYIQQWQGFYAIFMEVKIWEFGINYSLCIILHDIIWPYIKTPLACGLKENKCVGFRFSHICEI